MNEIITLDNGIRIALDPISYVRSASFGVWIESGSVHEDKKQEGISHFIEHMAFKGTANRTALQIATEFDAIGGQSNAFTSKEMTCYYAKTLDTHTLQGFDILSDMILHSLFAKKDITTEKKVIKEEIAMTEDSPEDLVVERLCEAVWHGHPLANRILGTKKTVSAFDTDALKEHINKNYCANNTIITVSGSFVKDDIISFVKERFGSISEVRENVNLPLAKYSKSVVVKEKKDNEQNHICIGFEGYSNDRDDEYFAISVLNSILGGGMSSRLFQKIREESGLAYSIYSYPIRNKEGGLFCIYVGLNAGAEQKAIGLIKKEIEQIIKNGITKEELSRAREQLKSGVIMGLEGTSSRATHMGRSILMHNRIKSLSEIIAKIDEVDEEKVKKVAQDIFNFNMASISVVGKVKNEEFYSNLIY